MLTGVTYLLIVLTERVIGQITDKMPETQFHGSPKAQRLLP